MSELIKCDICGEDINLEDEFYRIGENHEGEEINFCESCDNSELEDAAHCIPYGVEWADSEKYYYSQHYKLMNEYYEDVNYTTDSEKFPITKILIILKFLQTKKLMDMAEMLKMHLK